MKPILLGLTIGICTGLLWQWLLYRMVARFARTRNLSAPIVVGGMLLRLTVVMAVLGALMVLGGVEYLLPAVGGMIVVTAASGILVRRGVI